MNDQPEKPEKALRSTSGNCGNAGASASEGRSEAQSGRAMRRLRLSKIRILARNRPEKSLAYVAGVGLASGELHRARSWLESGIIHRFESA